jgi:tellurite resistance protein TerC
MTAVSLFPFAEYWWFYAAFTLFVLGMLALDLGVFHRRAHEVPAREALSWSAVWTALAIGFAALLYGYCLWKFPGLSRSPGAVDGSLAWQVALEFLTGFLIEKSLALDNIFVFVVIFQFFAIPAKYQHRILFFGILGALAFRVIFIALGAVLLQYKAVVIFFWCITDSDGSEDLVRTRQADRPRGERGYPPAAQAPSGHTAGRQSELLSPRCEKLARDALAGGTRIH